MHEILRSLPRGAYVLDLGSASDSFPASATEAVCLRLDRDPPARNTRPAERRIQADAAGLPLRTGAVDCVISNHSLEHFDDLEHALAEIGRVLKPGGALFVSVPDASTITDKVYRWIARGGGHVNPFTSAPDLASRIEQATGLTHVATRVLFSSLSFLNNRNAPRPLPKRLFLLGGGTERSLFAWAWLSRRLDRLFGCRTSVYGWAFYFGVVPGEISTDTWVNVCIRCGSGHAAAGLNSRRAFLLRAYDCPTCGATNPWIPDFEVRN